MKLWIRKVFVILISIMTLGMYIPPIYLNANAENSSEAISSKTNDHGDTSEVKQEGEMDFTLDNEDNNENESGYYYSLITEKAKEQTISKLGPKIAKQVEADFMTDILPNIEQVLKMILQEVGEEEIQYYSISERPTQGYGEKIFNIYDYRTKKDVVRFHVRRDNRPLEGYWFNFHYHLSNDGFAEHHEIGEIYWDKNTPPKWMS